MSNSRKVKMTRPQAKAIAKAVMLRDMAVGLARTGEA